MTINDNIEGRIVRIKKLLLESDRAADDDRLYDEGCYLAACRDECDVLIERVESLGRALRERDYPNERFYEYGERIRPIRVLAVKMLRRVESKLAAN